MNDLSSSTVLIKIGGSTLGSGDTSFADVAALQRAEARIIVVHGGGPETTSWMAKLGIRAEFVDGLRVTDAPGLEVATAVLGGLINKRLVGLFAANGVHAVGVSGVDGGLIRGEVSNPALGFVAGDVEVDPTLLNAIMDGGFVPVISPIGSDKGNRAQLLNVNADTVAGSIAVAAGATHLVFLTDVDGIMDANHRVLSRISLETGEVLIDSGIVRGGMIPKLQACLQAAGAGISAHIVNGTRPRALLDCIEGVGAGTAVV